MDDLEDLGTEHLGHQELQRVTPSSGRFHLRYANSSWNSKLPHCEWYAFTLGPRAGTSVHSGPCPTTNQPLTSTRVPSASCCSFSSGASVRATLSQVKATAQASAQSNNRPSSVRQWRGLAR
ncbi:unnamed protein product [Merluccius merluccius]